MIFSREKEKINLQMIYFKIFSPLSKIKQLIIELEELHLIR